MLSEQDMGSREKCISEEVDAKIWKDAACDRKSVAETLGRCACVRPTLANKAGRNRQQMRSLLFGLSHWPWPLFTAHKKNRRKVSK